ncbi:MAG: biotin/lipoyl-binding protein [Clostridia bacterium]|nr:biotin/lipoyl-binding protein [Clostridia bacterium]
MRKFQIVVNGTSYIVDVEELAAGQAPAPVAAAPAPVAAPKAAPAAAPKAAPAAPAGAEAIKSPMPGTINAVNVTAGQAVKKGDVLCILEAMKMENEIKAPRDGSVASVNVTKGQSVASGDVLLSLN